MNGQRVGVPMTFAVSALWRHSHRWAYAVWLIGGFAVGMGWPTAGIVLLWGGFACVLWELAARRLAWRHGYSVLYVLPSPAAWITRRLKALGYAGPVARRVWEMHVNETVAWHHLGDPGTAVERFRVAYTRDRLRWLQERPDDVGLIITTFNRLPADELAALQAAGAWVVAGPLDARIPSAAQATRQRTTQRRMFGRIVSDRDRTDPAQWTTIYVPARH